MPGLEGGDNRGPWGRRSLTFVGFTVGGYFKRGPRKSKAGTDGNTLSKYPGSGCEEGYQTIKCLHGNSEKQAVFLITFFFWTCEAKSQGLASSANR